MDAVDKAEEDLAAAVADDEDAEDEAAAPPKPLETLWIFLICNATTDLPIAGVGGPASVQSVILSNLLHGLYHSFFILSILLPCN